MIYTQEQVTIEQYHDERDWLTHSRLKTYANGGPRLYQMAHVQRMWKRKETPALKFGKAFETLAFEPRLFDATYICKPAGKEGDGRTKEGKAWNEANAHRLAFVLDPDELAIMRNMVEALNENETALELLKSCRPQQTYSAEWCKGIEIASRADFDSDGCAASGFAPFSLDLKTTDDITDWRSGKAIFNYGYHSQGGLAQWCMQKNGVQNPLARVLWLVIEKSAAHRCEIFEADGPAVDIGFRWCAEQIDAIAGYTAAGVFPRVNNEIQTIGLPAWVSREWQTQIRQEGY